MPCPTKTPCATSLVGVLMSPDFLYRIDLLDTNMASAVAAARKEIVKTSALVPTRALSAYALASRLSYFLWSSMPDDELLRHAAAGDLHKPDVLLARPAACSRTTACAASPPSSAATGWTSATSKPTIRWTATRFPTFNNDLREAMFQEPVHFIAGH